MREPSGELNQTKVPGGEMAITAIDRENRRIVLDLEDIRRRCDALYAAWEKDGVVPKLELSADQIALIRDKMEARGFDRLVWVQSSDRLPTARNIIEKTVIERGGIPPEFFGRMDAINIDGLVEERPAEPYLVLTRSGAAETWTRGKSPEEIQVLLRRLGESGLTLREYLLIENLKGGAERPGTRSDSVRTIGEYLPGSALPDGEIVAVSRGAAGDLSITSADPRQSHPDYGARGALVIPL